MVSGVLRGEARLKRRRAAADTRTMPDRMGREFFDGWVSGPARAVLLGFGWLLWFAGLGIIVVALALEMTAPALAGLGLVAAARLVAAVLPAPRPAPRRDVRRRMASLRRVAGHHLPS